MYAEIEHKLGAKIAEVKVLKSGWAGEIVSLRFDGNNPNCIVKTYQNNKDGLQTIRHEWQGLNFLHQAGYPVPRPMVSNFDADAPYMVMQEIAGQNLWDVYQSATPQRQRELLTRFIRAFYDLHQLDVSITGAAPASPFVDSELAEIEALIRENDLTGFDSALVWLRQHQATLIPEKPSILHRDYHPWNVLVDGNDQIYVLDLLWGLGDYRFDLAWLCTLMERSGFDDFSRESLRLYQDLLPGEIADLDYFRVLATLRWLANVSISLTSGENLNETRSAEFRDFIRPLIEKGWAAIREISGVG